MSYARSPRISGGSVRSSSITCCFCASVASGTQANSTTCRNIAIPSLAETDLVSHLGRSGPREHPQRVLQHRADVAEHGRAQLAVDDAVIEGQAQRGDLPDRQLSLV